MKKTWIALMLAVCLLLTTMAAASACCTDTSDMNRTQTMEERCPCMMDGKGVDGCGCTGDACGEDCACMGEEPCMKDGACTEDCQCAGSCNDIEAKMGMLEDELNAVFETNMALWEKFFGLMDKQPDMDTEYADYLMEQLDAAKDKFTDEEYTLLQQDIETIRRIDREFAMLEEQLMPDETIMAGKCMKDGQCVSECPCEEGTCTEACDCMKDEMYQDADMMDDMSTMFPAFEGEDLDGNPVTSDLFKENSVTVINFWFSGCAPCVAELGELNELNETLKLRGGAVIGVNTDTLGGNEKMIAEAKDLLMAKGAEYQNIRFVADSEAGQLAGGIMAFPTTIVVDRNGHIVGEAILGGINNDAQMKALQALIDETLAKDVEMLDKDMMMKPDGN